MSTLKANKYQHVDRTSPSIEINADGSVSIASTVTYEDVTSVDSIGIVTARSGVHIDDSIVHIGDTNTKIRFPAADTITAETAGTERLRVDSSGRLLLGTTTEGFATYGDKFTIANSSHCGMTIRSGTSSYGTIYFSDGDDGSADEVRGFLEYYHSDNRLALGTNGSPRLNITATGLVGIGTAVPAIPSGGGLEIHHSDVARLKLSTTSTGVASGDGFQIYMSDSSAILENKENAEMRFYTNALERSRITSAGNIGVGNDGSFPIYTDANDRTIIIGTGSDDAAIQIHSGTDKYGGLYFGDATSGGARYQGYVEYKHDDDYLRFGAGGTERMRIDSSGRVIITNDSVTHSTGTNTQYAHLTVRGNSTATSSRGAFLNFARSEASANIGADEEIGIIWFGDQQAGEYAAIKCNADAAAAVGDYPGRLTFWTTADGGTTMSERLRITSEGGTKFTRLTTGGTEAIGNNPNEWFKVGTWAGSTVDAAARATITVLGADTHNSNANVSGETKIHLAFSSNPTLYGYFYSNTASYEGISGVAHKYNSGTKSAEIWVKYSGGYGSIACYADVTNGYFTGEYTATGSTSTPSGATLLESWWRLLTSNGTNSVEAIRVNSSGDVRIGSNNNEVAKLELRYSTVPAFITNSYDGTYGETTFSNNIARTSDGSAAWGSWSNTSYSAAAVQLLSSTSSSLILFQTSTSPNTNPTSKLVISGEGRFQYYTSAGSYASFRQSFKSGALSNGATFTAQTHNCHACGTVTITSNLDGSSNNKRCRQYPISLNSTSNANLGSALFTIDGSTGQDFSVAGTSKGVIVTNSSGNTVYITVTFDITGSV